MLSDSFFLRSPSTLCAGCCESAKMQLLKAVVTFLDHNLIISNHCCILPLAWDLLLQFSDTKVVLILSVAARASVSPKWLPCRELGGLVSIPAELKTHHCLVWGRGSSWASTFSGFGRASRPREKEHHSIRHSARDHIPPTSAYMPWWVRWPLQCRVNLFRCRWRSLRWCCPSKQ